jgi:hypothetical protein
MTGLTAKALAPRLAAAMPERMHSGSARDHLEHRHPPPAGRMMMQRLEAATDG